MSRHDSAAGHQPTQIVWPEGKKFAFTVFDDPDYQRLEGGQAVYSLLRDLGFRTTKGVWPLASPLGDDNSGVTCHDPGVLPWLKDLQQSGFEIGFHNASTHTSTREQTIAGLDAFREFFGSDPATMAQHFLCDEGIYWGAERVSGLRRAAYALFTLGRNRGKSRGSQPGDPLFWGDVCQSRIRYMRNFVFRDTNTLQRCPYMPYHDDDRPFVHMWYASTDGVGVERFCEAVSEANQDRLEEEGGACIMYTHFAYRFYRDGQLNARFRELMVRMSRKNGWFVPVGTLLDFLRSTRSQNNITKPDRARLENRWLLDKIRYGTS